MSVTQLDPSLPVEVTSTSLPVGMIPRVSGDVRDRARQAIDELEILPMQASVFAIIDALDRAQLLATPITVARPLADWNEGMGDVVWWAFPVDEAPWIGSPLGDDWPDYHTHWTDLPPIPMMPTTDERTD